MAAMMTICSECAKSSHALCINVGRLNYWGSPEPCYCKYTAHPARRDIVGPNGTVLYPAIRDNTGNTIADGMPFHVGQPVDVPTGEIITAGLIPPAGIPSGVFLIPPADPGILDEAFPELSEEPQKYNHRKRPDAEVIRELYDVEIQNNLGEWVPVVPLPLDQAAGMHQCLCGTWRFGKMRYQEHYAYAHILGMEDNG